MANRRRSRAISGEEDVLSRLRTQRPLLRSNVGLRLGWTFPWKSSRTHTSCEKRSCSDFLLFDDLSNLVQGILLLGNHSFFMTTPTMEGWDKSTPVNLWMTHECFQEDTFGTHLVDGSANLEAWRTDRTSPQSAFPAVTADTEWEELLITDEVFPSFFDDVVHESEIQAPQTHYFNNSNESSNNIPPSIITPLIPIRKSFHKCKTSKKTLRQQDGKKLDENGLAGEVATVIERGIQEDILSQTPTLYSLLRAWVVGNTNNSQRYYIRPKRKTLVDYLSTRSKPIDSHQPTKFHPKHTAKNGQTNIHSNRAYHPPPIDILEWLKIRHILKESSPYSKYDASQMHKTRVRKARIQRILRKKEAEHAQQNLANKGIKVK